MELTVIARIRTDFAEKFGVPRQSGLVATRGTVVFEPPFRDPQALRGIEGFSHIWLLWHFSENRQREGFSPTVRPPRLGGNTRMGVFATRSPVRPNPIGLSCVKLLGVRHDERLGDVLEVEGADLVDNTPIFDIKPYLPYADCIAGATGGFAPAKGEPLTVCFAAATEGLPRDLIENLTGVLAQDPRPSYQDDPTRVYGMTFAGYTVKFTVAGDILTVTEIYT